MQSNKKSTRGVATHEVLRSNDTAKRSAEIVVAARELYEEKGLASRRPPSRTSRTAWA